MSTSRYRFQFGRRPAPASKPVRLAQAPLPDELKSPLYRLRRDPIPFVSPVSGRAGWLVFYNEVAERIDAAARDLERVRRLDALAEEIGLRGKRGSKDRRDKARRLAGLLELPWADPASDVAAEDAALVRGYPSPQRRSRGRPAEHLIGFLADVYVIQHDEKLAGRPAIGLRETYRKMTREMPYRRRWGGMRPRALEDWLRAAKDPKRNILLHRLAGVPDQELEAAGERLWLAWTVFAFLDDAKEDPVQATDLRPISRDL